MSLLRHRILLQLKIIIFTTLPHMSFSASFFLFSQGTNSTWFPLEDPPCGQGLPSPWPLSTSQPASLPRNCFAPERNRDQFADPSKIRQIGPGSIGPISARKKESLKEIEPKYWRLPCKGTAIWSSSWSVFHRVKDALRDNMWWGKKKKSLNNFKDEFAEAVGMSLVFMRGPFNVKVKEMGCMDFRNYNDKFDSDKLVMGFRKKV